jgi:hypothetical protein
VSDTTIPLETGGADEDEGRMDDGEEVEEPDGANDPE